jgi:hypothetical protein
MVIVKDTHWFTGQSQIKLDLSNLNNGVNELIVDWDGSVIDP